MMELHRWRFERAEPIRSITAGNVTRCFGSVLASEEPNIGQPVIVPDNVIPGSATLADHAFISDAIPRPNGEWTCRWCCVMKGPPVDATHDDG